MWLSLVWQSNVNKWLGVERKWSFVDLRRFFLFLLSINCNAVSTVDEAHCCCLRNGLEKCLFALLTFGLSDL